MTSITQLLGLPQNTEEEKSLARKRLLEQLAQASAQPQRKTIIDIPASATIPEPPPVNPLDSLMANITRPGTGRAEAAEFAPLQQGMTTAPHTLPGGPVSIQPPPQPEAPITMTPEKIASMTPEPSPGNMGMGPGNTGVTPELTQPPADDEREKRVSELWRRGMMTKQEEDQEIKRRLEERFGGGKAGTAKRFFLDVLLGLGKAKPLAEIERDMLQEEGKRAVEMLRIAQTEANEYGRQNRFMTGVIHRQTLADKANALRWSVAKLNAAQKAELMPLQAAYLKARTYGAETNASAQDMQNKVNEYLLDQTKLLGTKNITDPVSQLMWQKAQGDYVEKYGQTFDLSTATPQQQQDFLRSMQAHGTESAQWYAQSRGEHQNTTPYVSVKEIGDTMVNGVPMPMFLEIRREGRQITQNIKTASDFGVAGTGLLSKDPKARDERNKAISQAETFGQAAQATLDYLVKDPAGDAFGVLTGSAPVSWLWNSGWFQSKGAMNKEAGIRMVIDKLSSEYVYAISGMQTNEKEVQRIRQYMPGRNKNAMISARFALTGYYAALWKREKLTNPEFARTYGATDYWPPAIERAINFNLEELARAQEGQPVRPRLLTIQELVKLVDADKRK